MHIKCMSKHSEHLSNSTEMPWQLIINLESWWYYLPSYVYFRKCKNSLISVIRAVLETTRTIFTFLNVCFNNSRLIANKVAHKCSNLVAASKIFTFPLYNHMFLPISISFVNYPCTFTPNQTIPSLLPLPEHNPLSHRAEREGSAEGCAGLDTPYPHR